uniref:Plant heme peroxidase family profile domain-containing protein n=1 Tax=Aegilops tauschii subsp. strangulata TaxID=200361 RepID=A0A453QMG4_AEGTS
CAELSSIRWSPSRKKIINQVDTGLRPSYAAQLRVLCSPDVLDNNYYKLLPRGMGLFFSDNQLRVDGNLNICW